MVSESQIGFGRAIEDLDDVTVLRRKGLTVCSVTVVFSQCC